MIAQQPAYFIWLLEVATSLSSVLRMVSLILVSGSQIKQVSNGRGPLSLCFYSVAKGGPYCFLTQVFISFPSLMKLQLCPSLWYQGTLALSVAWLGTTDFIALTCNWIFLRFFFFFTGIDLVQWNQWAFPLSSTERSSLRGWTIPLAFSTLDSGLKMKAPRSVILFPAQGFPVKKSAVSKWFL